MKKKKTKKKEKDREGLSTFLTYAGIMGLLNGAFIPQLFVDNPDKLGSFPLIGSVLGAGVGVGLAYLFTLDEEISESFATIVSIGLYQGYFLGYVYAFLYTKNFVNDDDDFNKRSKAIVISTLAGTLTGFFLSYYIFKDEKIDMGDVFIVDAMQLWFAILALEGSLIVSNTSDPFGDQLFGTGFTGALGVTAGLVAGSVFAKYSNLTLSQAKAISKSTGAGTLAVVLYLIFDPRSFISFGKLSKYNSREIGLYLMGGTLGGMILSSLAIAIWGDDPKSDPKKDKEELEKLEEISYDFLKPRMEMTQSELPNNNKKENILYSVEIFSVRF